MRRLKVLHIEDNVSFGGQEGQTLLNSFKQYASVPDSSRDALLNTILRSSVRRVQEYADMALVKTRLQLDIELPDDGRVRLYMGGGEVVSVKDERGESVPFVLIGRDRIQVRGWGRVSIEYVTEPVQEDVEKCLPVVFRHATAVYDGESTEVLNTILNEVLC